MSDVIQRGLYIPRLVHKYLFLGMLVFVIGQQIYAPQVQKYFHLALLFAFMALNDARSHETRNFVLEVVFLASIAMTSIVSIIEAAAHLSLGWAYAAGLVVAGVTAIMYLLDLRKHLRNKDRQMFGENHQMIFNKSTLLFEIILIITMVVIFVADAYVISRIFT